MVQELPDRTDIRIVRVPAYEAAAELGNTKAANMIMLGAYVEATHAVDQESILFAFAERGIKPEMLQNNRRAIEMGRRIVSEK